MNERRLLRSLEASGPIEIEAFSPTQVAGYATVAEAFPNPRRTRGFTGFPAKPVGLSMCATFTDDDVGKLVERADGKVIGTVASLDTATVRVEPAPDVVDAIKARFGWEEIGGPFILHETDVREISETRVHLADGFSRANAPTPTADESADHADAEGDDEAAPETDPEDPNRTNGGTGSVANSAADSSGVGPFNSRFQIGAAVVSGLSFLFALVFAWTGYQEMALLAVGPELNIVAGMAGLMLAGFVGVVALVAAFYMEPGFDQ